MRVACVKPSGYRPALPRQYVRHTRRREVVVRSKDPPASHQSHTHQGPRGRGLTAREAAEYLGVKESTLSKWRTLGKGPRYSCALGRDPRYALADLEEFLWSPDRIVTSAVQARSFRRGAPGAG